MVQNVALLAKSFRNILDLRPDKADDEGTTSFGTTG